MIIEKPLKSNIYDKEYFLEDCGGYSLFKNSKGLSLDERQVKSLILADLRPNMKVLDIGCGRGEIVLHCGIRKNITSVGIDYSNDALTFARQSIFSLVDPKRTLLVRSDAKNLPFSDRMFDRIFMADIVEHLHGWELNKMLNEAYKILKPQGFIVIHSAPNRWYYNYGYQIYRLLVRLSLKKLPRDIRTRYEKKMHVNEQSILSLKKHLQKNGFVCSIWLNGSLDAHQSLENIKNKKVRGVLYYLVGLFPLNILFHQDLYAIAWKDSNLKFPRTKSKEKLLEADYLPLTEKNINKDMLLRSVKIGENDIPSLGEGWYHLENWPPKIRWTKKEASVYLKADNASKLYIEAFSSHPDIDQKPLKGYICINGKITEEFSIIDNDWKTLKFKMPKFRKDKEIKITINIDRTWIPDKFNKSGDRRRLGLAIHKIWVE